MTKDNHNVFNPLGKPTESVLKMAEKQKVFMQNRIQIIYFDRNYNSMIKIYLTPEKVQSFLDKFPNAKILTQERYTNWKNYQKYQKNADTEKPKRKYNKNTNSENTNRVAND